VEATRRYRDEAGGLQAPPAKAPETAIKTQPSQHYR
jgi:hypothetical protein